MKNIILFLLLNFLLTFSIVGQQGYIGRRFAFQFGIGSNFALLKPSNRFNNFALEKGIVLPKLTFGIQKENLRGNSAIWELSYQQLPNSIITTKDIDDDGYYVPAYIFSHYDSVWTKSDNFKLTYAFRRFKELGPLGNYIDFRFSTNMTFNKSLQLTEEKDSYVDYNNYNTTRTKIVTKSIIFIPQMSFGFGKVIPLSKRFALDFGGRGSIILGKFNDEKFDERLPNADIYHKIITSKKLVSTSLIEVYVNFLLFK